MYSTGYRAVPDTLRSSPRVDHVRMVVLPAGSVSVSGRPAEAVVGPCQVYWVVLPKWSAMLEIFPSLPQVVLVTDPSGVVSVRMRPSASKVRRVGLVASGAQRAIVRPLMSTVISGRT